MAKNITNQEVSGSGLGSGFTALPDNYTFTEDIKFPQNNAEAYTSNYEVRYIPISPPGRLAGLQLTKFGNIVHFTIPNFHGTLAVGNSCSVIRIVTIGDIPARFLPKAPLNWPLDAQNQSAMINVTQDHADLVITEQGEVDLISRTFLWNGDCGLRFDLHVCWHV